MSEEDGFKYYYSEQSEQFTFYRVPKSLFMDERFLALSSDSKVLYGLLLDRMGLSTAAPHKDCGVLPKYHIC